MNIRTSGSPCPAELHPELPGLPNRAGTVQVPAQVTGTVQVPAQVMGTVSVQVPAQGTGTEQVPAQGTGQCPGVLAVLDGRREGGWPLAAHGELPLGDQGPGSPLFPRSRGSSPCAPFPAGLRLSSAAPPF